MSEWARDPEEDLTNAKAARGREVARVLFIEHAQLLFARLALLYLRHDGRDEAGGQVRPHPAVEVGESEIEGTLDE